MPGLSCYLLGTIFYSCKMNLVVISNHMRYNSIVCSTVYNNAWVIPTGTYIKVYCFIVINRYDNGIVVVIIGFCVVTSVYEIPKKLAHFFMPCCIWMDIIPTIKNTAPVVKSSIPWDTINGIKHFNIWDTIVFT